MNREETYAAWKELRTHVDPDAGFADRVMEQIRRQEQARPGHRTQPSRGRRVWRTQAVAALLVVFLGLAVGWRRTALQSALLCAVFLGLFSVGFMSAARGLLFTAGGLLLVADFMLLSARRRTTGEQATALSPVPDGAVEAGTTQG